jgi:hypothetical protein
MVNPLEKRTVKGKRGWVDYVHSFISFYISLHYPGRCRLGSSTSFPSSLALSLRMAQSDPRPNLYNILPVHAFLSPTSLSSSRPPRSPPSCRWTISPCLPNVVSNPARGPLTRHTITSSLLPPRGTTLPEPLPTPPPPHSPIRSPPLGTLPNIHPGPLHPSLTHPPRLPLLPRTSP